MAFGDGRVGRSAAGFGGTGQPASRFHRDAQRRACFRPAGGLRLATLLLLFGASLVVPTLVATGLLLEREARTETEQLERRVEQVAGDLADDIDRQRELMAATLSVLAGSPPLATGGLQAFHDRAAATLHPLGLQLLYRGLDGQQLLNTRVPWGTPLPRRQLPEIDDAVRTTLKPHYSDMLVGAVAQRPVVTLTVPVLIEGALRGFLHMSIDSERLLAILKGHSAWRCTSSRPMPRNTGRCPSPKGAST